MTRFASSLKRASDSLAVDSNAPQPWVRPADWLALPSVAGLQRLVGIHQINVDSNFVAFSASGAYTVDWGDGTVTDYAAGATATRNYDYATIASTGESTLGYRQVIIQIYPQGGQNLTALNLSLKHTQATLSSYKGGWLDIALNAANLTSLTLSSSTVIAQAALQQFTMYSHSLTTLASLFINCSSLRSVPLFDTSNVTIMSSTFSGCSNLQEVPPFNTAAVTTMGNFVFNCYNLKTIPLFNTPSLTNTAGMFTGCYSLVTVPLFNMALVTSVSNMFTSCASLERVPLFNTASVTNFGNMFNSCAKLKEVPLFNTAAATSMASMFVGCTALRTVPLFNTALVTAMNSMFSGCTSLQSVPLFNTAAVTTFASMFVSCLSLTTIPLFVTSAATSMNAMFSTCSALQTIPLLNTASVTDVRNMFLNCVSLKTVPALNLASVTGVNFGTMFSGCVSLVSAPLSGPNQTISFASCGLSAAAINAIFTGLSGTGSGKTVTVTGNWGAATCTQSIATAKGWTVAV